MRGNLRPKKPHADRLALKRFVRITLADAILEATDHGCVNRWITPVNPVDRPLARGRCEESYRRRPIRAVREVDHVVVYVSKTADNFVRIAGSRKLAPSLIICQAAVEPAMLNIPRSNKKIEIVWR